MKKKTLILLFAAALLVGASGCAANKKNKCNTCPKWEDSSAKFDRP
jgi:hypothetical protein